MPLADSFTDQEVKPMPLAASFIDLDPARDKLYKGVFKGPWYTVLANIYGVPHSDIGQRDRTRKKRQRRITTALVAGIIAALIVALIQRKEAVSQRELAEKARNDAEGLIGFMIFDLRDKLKPIGRLDLLDSVNQRVNEYYKSMATENPSPDILRSQSVALNNNGNVLLAQGRLDDALAAFTAGKDIAEKLAARDTTNTGWQRDLAIALRREADIAFAQAQRSETAAAMDRAANIYARLAETLNTPETRSESAEAWGALAWYLLFDNQPEEAIEAARKGLETDPSQMWITTNLAHGHLFCGRYAEAEQIYRNNCAVELSDGRRFDQTVLDDFKEMRDKGMTHPDMERIEKLLVSRR